MLLPAICLSVFDHFVGLTLNGLSDTDRKFTVAAIPWDIVLCYYVVINWFRLGQTITTMYSEPCQTPKTGRFAKIE